MADYVTRAQVKANLEITDTDRDSLIDQAISAASRMVDKTTGRSFGLEGSASARIYYPVTRAARQSFGDLLRVDDIGNTTGLVVETGNAADGWTVVASTDYDYHPENALVRGLPIEGILQPGGYWPRSQTSRVRVTARWGWPAVPDDVEQATLIQSMRLFNRRNSTEGVTGSSEWGSIRLSRVDPDVMNLLWPFTLHGFR